MIVDEFTLGPVVAHGLVGDTHLATTARARGGPLRQAHLTLLSPAAAALEPWALSLVGVDVDPRLARLDAAGGPDGGARPRWSGWIATDVVRSEPLEVAIETSTLAARLRLGQGLAEALATLHARGRAHGHVNLDSVALRRERNGALLPLLLHTGARLLLSAGQAEEGELARRVQPYLAPELAGRAGAGAEPAADVHALGAVVYELLTGRAPGTLEGEATAAAIQRSKGRRTHFVAALQDEGEAIDVGALNDLLARCLSPRPADRPAAGDAARALAACLDGAPAR